MESLPAEESACYRPRRPRIGVIEPFKLGAGLLWPEPLIQLNPAFESGGMVDELTVRG